MLFTYIFIYMIMYVFNQYLKHCYQVQQTYYCIRVLWLLSTGLGATPPAAGMGQMPSQLHIPSNASGQALNKQKLPG